MSLTNNQIAGELLSFYIRNLMDNFLTWTNFYEPIWAARSILLRNLRGVFGGRQRCVLGGDDNREEPVFVRFYIRGLIHMDIHCVRHLVGKQGEEQLLFLLDVNCNNGSKVIAKA